MLKVPVSLFTFCLVAGCATKTMAPEFRVPASFKLISKKSESEIGYSLDRYYFFQTTKKVQVAGNAVKKPGVLDYVEGMTATDAIERSGGSKACFGEARASVKRAHLGFLLIFDAPLSGQLLAGDAVYANCAR